MLIREIIKKINQEAFIWSIRGNLGTTLWTGCSRPF